MTLQEETGPSRWLLRLTKTSLIIECAVCLHSYHFVLPLRVFVPQLAQLSIWAGYVLPMLTVQL